VYFRLRWNMQEMTSRRKNETVWASQLVFYTVIEESRHLIAQNVTQIATINDVRQLFSSFGEIQQLYHLKGVNTEEFTKTYLISYSDIQDARSCCILS